MSKYFAEKEIIESADLFITNECQLGCTYCFHPKSKESLSVETGKEIMRRMHEAFPDAFKWSFFGGEPLLYPDRVLELAHYAEELWGEGKVGFSVTTNCMFFDEKVFKEFARMHFHMCLSFDGDRETTLAYRKGSDYDKITDNIKNILKILPEATVRMTFSPDTVGRLARNVQIAHELGANVIMPHAVMEVKWEPDFVKQYSYQLKQIYHYRRFINKQGGNLNIVSIDKPLKILNDELPPEKRFCEAGNSYIAIKVNGDVHPCHRAASNNLFKLGNILEAEPFIVRGMFIRIDKDSVGCSNHCQCYATCHTCLIVNYMVNGAIENTSLTYCALNKVEFDLARDYLSVELGDRRDRMLNTQALVLADLVDQNEEFKAEIRKLKEEKK